MKMIKLFLTLMLSFFLVGGTAIVSAEEQSNMQKIDNNSYILADKTDTSDTIFDVNATPSAFVAGVLVHSKTINVKISGNYVPTSRYYSEYNGGWYAGTLYLTAYNQITKTATYSGILNLRNQ